ncbi:MAG: ABC transporter permease, partial [Gammaproteobacteria bacterium]|nr:ABC transporter permease [Gammaproteobacteria bacterium]
MNFARHFTTLAGLLLAWQFIVWATKAPAYILPTPIAVAAAFAKHADTLLQHAATTIVEILVGLLLGTALGFLSALSLSSFRAVRRWLLPVLVVSQALPVFALAPILMLWLGYGMASKIAMAVLIIYFPVTAACFDGLRHTPNGWLELAATMSATPRNLLRSIRVPAALPAAASGMRVATAVAPIGAVVGEWVGSSAGLGYLMLHANGRMQIDLMFAALVTLAVFALGLYFSVDHLL